MVFVLFLLFVINWTRVAERNAQDYFLFLKFILFASFYLMKALPPPVRGQEKEWRGWTDGRFLSHNQSVNPSVRPSAEDPRNREMEFGGELRCSSSGSSVFSLWVMAMAAAAAASSQHLGLALITSLACLRGRAGAITSAASKVATFSRIRSFCWSSLRVKNLRRNAVLSLSTREFLSCEWVRVILI